MTVRQYIANAIALLLLLGLTLGMYLVPLGPFKAAVSLAIAVAKAALVALFFMHLKFASPITRVFAVAALVWLAILMGLTLAAAHTWGA